jgi:soluble lytic murein transglycosylase
VKRLLTIAALMMAPGAAIAAAPATPALTAAERSDYRAIFAAIRSGQWADAEARLNSTRDHILYPVARAELYTAKGSPKVELDALMALLTAAPDLPHAAQLGRLATTRGATALPALPAEQRLVWLGSAPLRGRAETVRSDAAAAALSAKILPLIKEDNPAAAEALILTDAGAMSQEALTEWRQRVAWSYYLTGDDANARRLATVAQAGSGEWAAHADWVVGLASWRQRDCAAAGKAFQSTAQRAQDSEMRAAGHFWAARADMACGRPQSVQARLRTAALMPETFYGLLAQASLGIAPTAADKAELAAADWKRLGTLRNVRVAMALVEVGETKLAGDMLRHQAKIGLRDDHDKLIRLAGRMNMPDLQLWLAHNGPAGARPRASARYPAPAWTPDGGWRVDRSLVFAHALQESRFRADVVSPAGAYGLMQVMPAAASHMARRKGVTVDRSQLSNPSTNMEYGQSYLEYLRDYRGTQGLLPKVIAAYNAGPAPIDVWNGRAFDRGDPLLYIESIPYWETRAYVGIVLRNYWMYQQNAGETASSLKAMAQGMWPRFPGLSGAVAVRMQPDARMASSAD